MARSRSARACRAWLDKAEFDRAGALLRSRLRAAAGEIGKIIERRGTAITTTARRRARRPGRAIADPDYELSSTGRRRASDQRAERQQKSAGSQVAHPADQRLVAQRPDLPGEMSKSFRWSRSPSA
jgi:hypothetical protein